MSEKNVKKRNWAFVVYPDSAPAGWVDYLQETGLQCAIGPLHDKDLNATGEPKKPHYHVIACYSGPTSYNVVKGLTDALNAPIPQPLEQLKGYYRYLTHMDNPEKAQYSPDDIYCINGFNILDYSDLTRSELTALKLKMLSYIRDADILEYSDFLDLLQDNAMLTEFDIASSNTLFFDRYISSRRNKRAPKDKATFVDPVAQPGTI
jgi:hypothetical protein